MGDGIFRNGKGNQTNFVFIFSEVQLGMLIDTRKNFYAQNKGNYENV